MKRIYSSVLLLAALMVQVLSYAQQNQDSQPTSKNVSSIKFISLPTPTQNGVVEVFYENNQPSKKFPISYNALNKQNNCADSALGCNGFDKALLSSKYRYKGNFEASSDGVIGELILTPVDF